MKPLYLAINGLLLTTGVRARKPCTITRAATATTTTATSTAFSTPLPIQTDVAANCNRFHLVDYDDGCYKIITEYNIDLEDFIAWNPAVGEKCTGLWPMYYVCVGVDPNRPPPTTTAAGTGPIKTPAPTQAGMAATCDRFHQVQSGDICYNLAAQYRVPLADLYLWNPAVGEHCSYLLPGFWICVHAAPTTTRPPLTTTTTTFSISTRTTSAGNGIATPRPYQPAMTRDCNRFHLVVDGDTCLAIAGEAGVPLNDFYRWNPAVGADCESMWLGYYVCTGLRP